MLIIMQLKNSS